jgi:hypothetical protein
VGVDPAWRRSAIKRLLSGQRPDGGFGVQPYSKWKGGHWRLVSLVELGIPARNRAARSAAKAVLDWIATPRHTAPVIKGLERRHASIEGNAVAASCRLGLASSPQVEFLVGVLLRSQWPDGGWNCDRNPQAHRSSFHETLAPIRALIEYHRATGDAAALQAARRGGELLLEHRLFRSRRGEVINSEWMHIHWPHYWHYDYFHGLRAIAMLGLMSDARTDDARQVLLAARRADGTWCAAGRRYWRPSTEVVNWGDAHQMVTPAALALLR